MMKTLSQFFMPKKSALNATLFRLRKMVANPIDNDTGVKIVATVSCVITVDVRHG